MSRLSSSPNVAPMQWNTMPVDPTALPFVLLAEGGQGQGKTHLAYTFPQPIFHLDTENRGDKVGAKFVAAGVQSFWKLCPDFDSIRRTLSELVFPHFNGGTIVIDSASDLQSYAEAEWLVEAKAKKVWPQTLWSEVYDKLDTLIEAVRAKGFYLVFTARRKAEYANDKATGALVLEGYKRLPYLSDIHLLMENGRATVLKNGFRNTPEERTDVLSHPTFSLIHEQLIVAANKTAPVLTSTPVPAAPVPAPPFTPQAPETSPAFPTLDSLDLDPVPTPAPPRRPEETRCIDLARKCGMEVADFDEWLVSKGKPRLADMPTDQLSKVGDYLQGALDSLKKKGAA